MLDCNCFIVIIVDWRGFKLWAIIFCKVMIIWVLIIRVFMVWWGMVLWLFWLNSWYLKCFIVVIIGFGLMFIVFIGRLFYKCKLIMVFIVGFFSIFVLIMGLVLLGLFFVGWKKNFIWFWKLFWWVVKYCVVFKAIVVWLLWL